ncbi:unnamed protein product, partial [Closterium sp. NIES-54]
RQLQQWETKEEEGKGNIAPITPYPPPPYPPPPYPPFHGCTRSRETKKGVGGGRAATGSNGRQWAAQGGGGTGSRGSGAGSRGGCSRGQGPGAVAEVQERLHQGRLLQGRLHQGQLLQRRLHQGRLLRRVPPPQVAPPVAC